MRARLAPWLLAAAATLLADAPQPAPADAGPELLVTVGDVTATTAVLWVDAAGAVRLALDPGPGGSSLVRTLPPGRAVAELDGLTPGRRHRYRLDGEGVSVAGEFVTAPASDELAPVRLAWSGDLGARGHCRTPGGWTVLDAIAERRPDLFLLVGDTAYADHVCGAEALPGSAFAARTLEEFWAKHRYNRADPALQRLLRTTSAVAIWDDHDVRNNFAAATEPLAPAGLRAFLDFWPVARTPGDPQRLYRRLRWGRLLEIFVLDTRQYRSPNHVRDGPDKTMLGTAQRRWLLDAVAGSTARWKVIVSSVSLSIPKGWPFGDSWASRRVLWRTTGFAAERDAILAALRARGVRRLVALVADVHFGALMTHRPRPSLEVHELIAGPLAARPARPRPPAAGLSTRVHAAHGETFTFGELSVSDEGLTARLLDGAGRVLAEQRLDGAAP
jgi:alkaline phosphatase D